MASLGGDAMALGCALAWASSVLLFRRLKDVSAPALNLFKNTIATVLLGLTMLALGLRIDTGRSLEDWLALIGSGVLGLAVADSLFFAGLRRIDASVAAVTDCAYSPTVLLLSALWLGEAMSGSLIAGGSLVVLGLLVVSWRSKNALVRVDGGGVLLAIAGVTLTAVGVVLAKSALDRSGLIEATTVRLVAGTTSLAIFQLATGKWRESVVLFRPQRLWRYAIPGTLLGTYLSMILWLGGMKYGTASRAALLNQMGAVFALVLSRLSGEQVPPRRWIGAGIAVAGVAVVVASRG